jgi:predicted small lipoprotein YifL
MYRILIPALLTVLLAACGQTGPLYLPKEEPVPAPMAAPPADDADAATEAPADEVVAPDETPSDTATEQQ